MSEESVDLVRRLYSLMSDEAFWRGGFADVFPDYFQPDFELVPPPIYPDIESTYHGLEGIRRWQRQIDEIWEGWRFEAEDVLDAGDRVVVLVRTSGTAKQSGAAVSISPAHVLTLRDGRVARLEVFLDRREALERSL